MQKVPISMTVLPADKLEAFGQAGQGVLPLASRAPSVYAGRVGAGRGIPALLYPRPGRQRLRPQCLAAGVDGVRRHRAGKSEGLSVPFDLEQVEVLLLVRCWEHFHTWWIEFESRKPPRRKPQATPGVSFGTADARAASAARFPSAWSARISALAQHRDDWIDNTFGKKDDLAATTVVRVQALYEPNSDFNALINVRGGSRAVPW